MYSVYLGSYQQADKPGIHHLTLNPESGELTYVNGTAGVENPSYLYWDQSLQHLYAVSESGAGAMVVGFRLDAEGGLEMENAQATSGGAPCHLMLIPDRSALLATNYMGASVDWFPLNDDGRLRSRTSQVQHEGRGPREDRQSAAHPHSAWVAPDGRHVLVPDLGLDSITFYRIDQSERRLKRVLTAASLPASGPRHLVFHPEGRYVYVINELDSTVSVYQYDGSGPALERLQTASTIPGAFAEKNEPAHIALSRDGSRLYASNRGHDSIAVFAVEDQGSRVRLIEIVGLAAKFPRHFALSPNERWMLVAGQGNNQVELLKMAEGGVPTPGMTMPINKPTVVVIA